LKGKGLTENEIEEAITRSKNPSPTPSISPNLEQLSLGNDDSYPSQKYSVIQIVDEKDTVRMTPKKFLFLFLIMAGIGNALYFLYKIFGDKLSKYFNSSQEDELKLIEERIENISNQVDEQKDNVIQTLKVFKNHLESTSNVQNSHILEILKKDEIKNSSEIKKLIIEITTMMTSSRSLHSMNEYPFLKQYRDLKLEMDQIKHILAPDTTPYNSYRKKFPLSKSTSITTVREQLNQ